MRKIFKKISVLSALMLGLIYNAQDNSIISSVLTPVGYQTGVPEISFPIVKIPASKDFMINFGLVYDANSYTAGDFSGSLGRNWMLSGSNFRITRKIVQWLDEEVGEWDDIYFYNIDGQAGSFKIEKTGTFPNDVYNIKMLTPTNIKIEHERIAVTYSSQRRPIQSFTITDSLGYKYFFLDFDNTKIPGAFGGTIEARNTFHINKIVDPNGRTVATFQNLKYINSSDSAIWLFLPENIHTDYGHLTIEHGVDNVSWSFFDRYYIKNMTIRDYRDNYIAKYELDYTSKTYKHFDIDLYQSLEAQVIPMRSLKELRKLDKELKIVEKTKFMYTYSPPASKTWGSLHIVPTGAYQSEDFLMNGLLKIIQLSSGGRIEYKYGWHTFKLNPPINYNNPAGIQQITGVEFEGYSPFSYKQKTDSIAFDSHTAKKYYLTNLQKSPFSRIYIKFFKDETYPWNGNPENQSFGPGNPAPKLAYKVKNYTNFDPTYGAEIEDFYAPRAYVVPSDGNAYLEITGSGGRGWFEIYEKFWTDPPYTIQNSIASSCGVKIEEIKYFELPSTNNDSALKTIHYDYDFFDEPGVSSGNHVTDNENTTMIYKNVKVTESDKSGSTKYYYKTPDDFPTYYPSATNPNKPWRPFFDFTKKGIAIRKEVISINNLAKNISKTEYIFPIHETLIPFEENYHPIKTNTELIIYDSFGNSISSTSEKVFNQENNNVMSEKNTTVEGITKETTYKYALEKGNAKLLNAGMNSVPLEVTQKLNGNETGKVETLYDHTGNYFPSAVKSYGIGSALVNEEKHDVYDAMGNVLQSTSKTGIPTTYVYGYGGTQLIAKIEGLKYQEVMQIMGQPNTPEAYKNLEIYSASNLDVDDASEEQLRQKLDAFRLQSQFKNYRITTYTYDPLIGIKSVTSPSGNKEYYYYDSANRLIRVEDVNHNIIKEHKYSPFIDF
ncbi:hypothetical protein [Chryseobacterium koreense]|uniref:hypothetical protein n=1 Tax=Chryseobacterium koreense TaxID=232216 RepID=UPI0026F0D1B4|nr:hypothetical protein [Chryseobacterium koreense]